MDGTLRRQAQSYYYIILLEAVSSSTGMTPPPKPNQCMICPLGVMHPDKGTGPFVPRLARRTDNWLMWIGASVLRIAYRPLAAARLCHHPMCVMSRRHKHPYSGFQAGCLLDEELWFISPHGQPIPPNHGHASSKLPPPTHNICLLLTSQALHSRFLGGIVKGLFYISN